MSSNSNDEYGNHLGHFLFYLSVRDDPLSINDFIILLYSFVPNSLLNVLKNYLW